MGSVLIQKDELTTPFSIFIGELNFKDAKIKLKRILDPQTPDAIMYIGAYVREEVFYYIMNPNTFIKNNILKPNYTPIPGVYNRGMIMTTAY